MALRLSVRVGGRPSEEGTTSLHYEGYTEIAFEDVLEGFGRHFLSWVNRWLDEGFAPVRTVWLQRSEGVGQTITVPLHDGNLTGTVVDLDDAGRLVLDTEAGRRTVGVWETPYTAFVASP